MPQKNQKNVEDNTYYHFKKEKNNIITFDDKSRNTRVIEIELVDAKSKIDKK